MLYSSMCSVSMLLLYSSLAVLSYTACNVSMLYHAVCSGSLSVLYYVLYSVFCYNYAVCSSSLSVLYYVLYSVFCFNDITMQYLYVLSSLCCPLLCAIQCVLFQWYNYAVCSSSLSVLYYVLCCFNVCYCFNVQYVYLSSTMCYTVCSVSMLYICSMFCSLSIL